MSFQTRNLKKVAEKKYITYDIYCALPSCIRNFWLFFKNFYRWSCSNFDSLEAKYFWFFENSTRYFKILKLTLFQNASKLIFKWQKKYFFNKEDYTFCHCAAQIHRLSKMENFLTGDCFYIHLSWLPVMCNIALNARVMNAIRCICVMTTVSVTVRNIVSCAPYRSVQCLPNWILLYMLHVSNSVPILHCHFYLVLLLVVIWSPFCTTPLFLRFLF